MNHVRVLRRSTFLSTGWTCERWSSCPGQQTHSLDDGSVELWPEVTGLKHDLSGGSILNTPCSALLTAQFCELAGGAGGKETPGYLRTSIPTSSLFREDPCCRETCVAQQAELKPQHDIPLSAMTFHLSTRTAKTSRSVQRGHCPVGRYESQLGKGWCVCLRGSGS